MNKHDAPTGNPNLLDPAVTNVERAGPQFDDFGAEGATCAGEASRTRCEFLEQYGVGEVCVHNPSYIRRVALAEAGYLKSSITLDDAVFAQAQNKVEFMFELFNALIGIDEMASHTPIPGADLPGCVSACEDLEQALAGHLRTLRACGGSDERECVLKRSHALVGDALRLFPFSATLKEGFICFTGFLLELEWH